MTFTEVMDHVAQAFETVGAAPTWQNVAVLGPLVLIRTFLSFSPQIEIDGAVPWRRALRWQRDPRPDRSDDRSARPRVREDSII